MKYDVSFTIPDISAPGGWREFWFDELNSLPLAMKAISAPKQSVLNVIQEDSILRVRSKSGELVGIGFYTLGKFEWATRKAETQGLLPEPIMRPTAWLRRYSSEMSIPPSMRDYDRFTTLTEYWLETPSAAEVISLYMCRSVDQNAFLPAIELVLRAIDPITSAAIEEAGLPSSMLPLSSHIISLLNESQPYKHNAADGLERSARIVRGLSRVTYLMGQIIASNPFSGRVGLAAYSVERLLQKIKINSGGVRIDAKDFLESGRTMEDLLNKTEAAHLVNAVRKKLNLLNSINVDLIYRTMR